MNEPDKQPVIFPAGQKSPHAVFISYSSDDSALAKSICGAFEADGIRCWIAPRDVQGGRPYPGQITQAIREARIVLLVLSGSANRSKHVLREVERGAHCQNYLLTFRVESIAPSDDLAYFLGTDQWVDGFQPLPVSLHFSTLIQHARALLQDGAAAGEPEEPEEAAAEVFAHYRVLRRPDGSLFRIGKGGMGVTYKGIDTVLNRPVALKVIASELLRSPQAKQRFLREAQAAALVQHPHVATVFHFGQEGDAYFYAMEFVEGEDLERYVARQGPLSPLTALRVTLQVAQALEAAQARQLIHRDIKPGNIMAVANRTGSIDVKLIDFGLAKGAGMETLDASRITLTRDFVGSPAFSSPEQCQTKRLDVRSDIYSLGVTLWYLISGKRPFSGSIGEVIVAQVTQPPPFDQLAQVPEPVLALLRRMLAKSPGERFQTPEELQDAIEQTAAGLSSQLNAVPEGIAAKATPATGELLSNQRRKDAPNVMLATLASPLFDTYLATSVGALLANRYRLLNEEREGNGGRLFLARDEQAQPDQPSEIAVKLLHPGITADGRLLDLLEKELEVIGQAAHPHLFRYFRLERGVSAPFLVREWKHGFLLYDLLRRRHSLRPQQLPKVLGPLAATVDFVASRGLGLVDVSVRKILIVCPPEVNPEQFQALAIEDSNEWKRCEIKLNPLCLAPLIFRERNGWDRQTIVPTSRVLSLTQAEAGIRGAKAVRLYGRLVYQILSGRGQVRGSTATFTPVPELRQEGNEALRRACISSDSIEPYRNCQEFWDTLQETFKTRAPSIGWTGSSMVVSTAVGPSSAPSGPPAKRKLPLLVAAIVGGALIVGLTIFSVIRFRGSEPELTANPASSVTPVKPSSSFPAATPELSPRQEQSSTTPTPTLPPAKTVSTPTASAPGAKTVTLPTSTLPKVTNTPAPTPTSTPPAIVNTPALTPASTPPAVVNTPALTPTSTPPAVVHTPAPTPTSTPPAVVHTPAPTPASTPQTVTSTPTPTPSRAEIFATPAPTNPSASVVGTPAPTPAPKPVVEPTLTPTPTPTNEQSAKKSLEQAYTEEKKGDHTLAARDFTEALRLQPGDEKTYRARAKVYVQMKQYSRAISDFSEAIRLRPNDAALYNDRAHAHQQLKEYEKAVADFTAAIRLEPGNVSFYIDRATAFEAMADKGKAEQDRAKAEELKNPGRTPIASVTPTPSATPRKAESPTETIGSAGATAFDGTWEVSVDAPNYVDPTGKHVRGFRSHYYVYVRNGVLNGEQPVSSKSRYPSPHVMNGKIQPDGSADLVVSGYSGDPIYSPGNEKPGTSFSYAVKAKFGGDHGTGNSVGYRPRAYAFVRRAR
jgi:tRNA A-37 threonylcarbamoyl transferase component Bud32